MIISLRPSTYAIGSCINLGSFGVTGSKGQFHQKCYNSSVLHNMCYVVMYQSGDTGVKRSFSLKYYNLPMLHNMIIRLIHDDQLETLFLCYGVMYQSGVIWGHRGQKVILSKKASTHSKYVTMTCDLCIRLTPATKVIIFKIHSGSFGSLGSKGHFTENAIDHQCYIV